MAIVLTRKEFPYSNKVIYKDEKTKVIIFELEVKLTEKEMLLIKDAFDENKESIEDEELYNILFKENYDNILQKVGEFKTQEFAIMLAIDVVGKLTEDRMLNINSVNTKYQKKLQKFQK